ncbi:hypothetical protein GUJ93_ZPchr0004g38743 [Zizania palustris]|uniref:Uncharacterized protein n=1 Tax=Zizania palustris TaxID=103762 RepID=A0A8J5SDH4_ZIZPA|nr:hypothetical protein GUJ93_ZPchr0004g38743 [Zizania palustris]
MPSSTPSSLQPAPIVQPLPSSTVGQSSRIDLCEIKSNIVKKIGPERAKKYFKHLERFLSSKLSKNEFDKLCLMTLGRENLPLHNYLIRSILRNACQANGPPAINAPKLTGDVTNSELAFPPVWNNGNVLNEHVNDNRPLSRRDSALTRHSSLNLGETIIRENGTPNLSDLKRRTQFQHNEHAEPITKRSHMEKVPLIFHEPPYINGPSAIAHGENLRDEIVNHIRGPVQAPLGIHFGPISFGGTQKPSTIASAPSNDSSLVGTRSQHGKLSHMPLKHELRRQPFRVSKDVLIYWSLIPDKLRGHNMEFSHSFKRPGFHANEQMMPISKWVTSMTEQMFSANNMRTLFFKTW